MHFSKEANCKSIITTFLLLLINCKKQLSNTLIPMNISCKYPPVWGFYSYMWLVVLVCHSQKRIQNVKNTNCPTIIPTSTVFQVTAKEQDLHDSKQQSEKKGWGTVLVCSNIISKVVWLSFLSNSNNNHCAAEWKTCHCNIKKKNKLFSIYI